MTATPVTCPHCGAMNQQGGAFCETCGKALRTTSSGPRVIDASSLPATHAGGELYGDQLIKQTKRAANTLLTVGIVQIVIGGMGVFAANSAGRGAAMSSAMLIGLSIVGAIGLIFIGLSIWARRAPLPASIVGLVLYATLIVLNVLVAVRAMQQNRLNGRTTTGIGVGWLDIVIVIFLVRGIQAALTHRRLMETRQITP